MIIKPPNPFLSIIIPTYNSGIKLSISLESIESQTFENIEVLIIDSKSNDDTLEVAKSYEKKIARLKVFSEPDRGIYDAMNKGISLAQGVWVYFMGSNDFLFESTTIEKFAKEVNANDVEVIYGNVYSTRFNGIYDGEFNYKKLVEKNICHQAIFFKKDLFKKTGKFNLRYRSHADWDHNIKWFFSSHISKKYVNQIFANYADGGFSSLNDDELFKKEKNLKLVLKGIRKLPISQLISLCNRAIIHAKTENSIISLNFLRMVRLSLKARKRLQTLFFFNGI